MSKPRVYIETSIPSFYHTNRVAAGSLARQEWTRMWWDSASAGYERVTSEAVFVELRKGDYPTRDAAIALMTGIPILEATPAISEIVDAYFRHRLMPRDPTGDALHLAMASYHRCDFLLTWNCRHLANANKFGHIRRVNSTLGLFVPVLTTPLELLGVSDE
jgi:predicted nucleic acid-binding protein